MKIPFVKPDISDDEIEAVSNVLRSGWITTGPVTKQFENELSEYLGTHRTACVNSQTMGAELVLHALDIGPGDEVILPAYTYTATCSVVYHVGATPILIDSQTDSPEMDYDAMEAAITERTKVIIPVDIGGIVCDYDRIYEAIERKRALFKANPDSELQQIFNRIVILADTAHSLGASSDKGRAGKLADFSSFSFHAVKNLTTAEGGAITWMPHEGLDDDKLYQGFMLLSLHGQNKDALNKTSAGSWEYDIVAPWFKGNLTDLASAIGLSQLQRYQDMLDRRHAIIQRYNEGFSDLPVTWLDHYKEGQYSSGHLFLLKLTDKDEDARNQFIIKMDDLGVTCNVHYKPLPMLSAYIDRGFDIKDYPKAYDYYQNLVSLPIYSTLTDDEVDYIIRSVREAL